MNHERKYPDPRLASSKTSQTSPELSINVLLYSNILKLSQWEGHPSPLMSTYHNRSEGSDPTLPHSLVRLITMWEL